MNNPRWEGRAHERIAARRRKIGELLADEQDFAKQECLWGQSKHLWFVEAFVIACERIAAGDLTPEELAHVERIRALFTAALEGKSWDELETMKNQIDAGNSPELRPVEMEVAQ
jgi:hypothetical protein